MRHIEQSGLVLALSDALRGRGSWAGETHVQKAGYLLQHLMQVPLGVKYILYKHGPFSFELRGIISEMESEDFIRWEPKPYPYGPTIMPGPSSRLLLASAQAPKSYRRQIEFVAEKLATKRVADLERLATALYVSLDASVPRTERALRIHTLKPHVSLGEATEAVLEMDRLRAEAEQSQMVLRRR